MVAQPGSGHQAGRLQGVQRTLGLVRGQPERSAQPGPFLLGGETGVLRGCMGGEAPVHLTLGEVADVAQMQDDPSLAAAQPAGDGA